MTRLSEQVVDSVREHVIDKARRAKLAARVLAGLSRDTKDAALMAMADALSDHRDEILWANELDMAGGRQSGLSSAMLDRLLLTPARIDGMVEGLRAVAALPDPIGPSTEMRKLENGLRVGKMRVPLGVIGIVFEARPNVTADTGGLCIKSGNAIVMRGGKEAINSNTAIVRVLRAAAGSHGVPEDAVQLIESTDRDAVRVLATLDNYIDLLVVRGGEGLVRAVTEYATVPLIKHGKGVCHTYVDKDADLSKAVEICYNAKVQRPGVCNAMESLLVHTGVAADFLNRMVPRYVSAGVELVGCKRAVELGDGRISLASDEDWDTEYLSLKLSIRVVDSYEQAVEHIFQHGTGHTEAIVTENQKTAARFLSEVDASAVFANCSTRFNDGFQLGLGAELGISTQKLHARGPMGLKELTCEKFVVLGDGQIRE